MVLMKGKLCTHDLASGRTDEVGPAAQLPMVLAMHLDGANGIWTGHKTGLLALWTEDGPSAMCSPLRLDSADIMCASCGARGAQHRSPCTLAARGPECPVHGSAGGMETARC